MPPRRQHTGAANLRPASYIYNSTHGTLNMLMPFVMGAAPTTPDGEQQPSAADRWLQDNPLQDGQVETEERTKDFRAWFETTAVQHVMQPEFRLWTNNTNPCPHHIARRISHRLFHLCSPYVLAHLNKYADAITSDMKWFSVERSERLRDGAVRAPLSMKWLAQAVPVNFTSAMIHAIALTRLKQKNNPTDTAFSLQLNPDARGLVNIILIHAINFIGMLLANVSEKEKCKGWDDACAVLRRMRFVQRRDVRVISYTAPLTCEKFVHDSIWPVLTQAITRPPIQFVQKYVNARPDAEFCLVKPMLGLPRRVLLPQHQIGSLQLLDAFVKPSDVANAFCTPFLRCIVASLVHLNVLTAQDAYHGEYPVAFIQAVSFFTKEMYRMFINHPHPARSAQEVARQLRSIDKMLLRSIPDFLSRRQSYTDVPAPTRRTTPASSSQNRDSVVQKEIVSKKTKQSKRPTKDVRPSKKRQRFEKKSQQCHRFRKYYGETCSSADFSKANGIFGARPSTRTPVATSRCSASTDND